ncbi:MAG: 1-acyl-sn-glycerol-3-phosphate acetyltransferase [Treponematales bacterium]
MIKTAAIFFLAGFTLLLVVPVGVVCFVLSFLGFRRLMAQVVYRVAQGWARLLVGVSGCAVEVSGRENIPRRGGVCFVSNHGSIFDIVLALAFAGRPFGFIAKKELLLIPFLNMWISILGGLFIDRARPRKALATIAGGVRRLRSGGGVLIFPEGHRSRGQGLLPFRGGAFKLAALSGVPVVPVAIAGSYEVFEKTGRVRAVPVRLVFCPPIDPASLPQEDRRQALALKVRGVIAAALGE